VKVVIMCFDRESHFLKRLTKLHQISIVDKFIATFEQLSIHTEDLCWPWGIFALSFVQQGQCKYINHCKCELQSISFHLLSSYACIGLKVRSRVKTKDLFHMSWIRGQIQGRSNLYVGGKTSQ